MSSVPFPPRTERPPELPVAIDVRSASLAVLAVIAVVFLLHWARAVLIPIMLAVSLRYALMPLVEWLEKRARIPSTLGAALLLLLIVGGSATGIAALQDEALDMLDKLPRAAQKLELAMRKTARDQSGAVAKLKAAASEIDKAATAATSPGTAQPPAPKSQADKIPQLSSYLWSGSLGLAVGLGQAIVVLALAYFLLISGDAFKRKLVRISGDTLAKKKITVQILEEIDSQIQRYLVVQIGTSALYGALCWLALAAIGMENAAFWGLVAGVLHLVPYIGPTVVMLLTGVVAYLQFPDITSVALVAGSLLTITGLIGFALVPMLTAKLGKISAVTVFIALLFWGWLWGFWGLLLGVPIVMAMQAICERVPDLEPIAELLGSEPAKPDAAVPAKD